MYLQIILPLKKHLHPYGLNTATLVTADIKTNLSKPTSIISYASTCSLESLQAHREVLSHVNATTSKTIDLLTGYVPHTFNVAVFIPLSH